MGDTTETVAEISYGMGEEIATALANACKGVYQTAKDGILVVLPYALGVMSLYMGIRLTINFFRSVAN